ncbi:MAG: MCE family protein [Aeromicrobium erythreum]
MRRSTAVVVVLVLLAAAFLQLRPSGGTRINAYFTSGTGLYVGDEVKVMGVKVGRVEKVVPDGQRVRVEMTVGDQPIPAGAKAAIVSPSLVNGRFVQLAPGYVDGPRMADGSTIPQSRTAVPVSFDEVKKELTALSTALGPQGAGQDPGALDEAITTLDDNLGDGNAERLRESVRAMRAASGDLSDNREDLFTTIKQLNTFTKNLVVNDAALRGASSELAGFSGTLADNGDQLRRTLKALREALRLVDGFLDDNTRTIGASLERTQELSKTLAGRTNALAQVFQTAATAAEGLYNTVENNAITGAASISNLQGTAQLVCGLVMSVGGSTTQCRDSIEPLLEVLNLSKVPGVPGNRISDLGQGTGSQQAPDPTKQLTGLVEGLTGGPQNGSGLLGGILGGGR